MSLFCAFVGYHVDEEYARRTPYKGRIVPSAFTMSVSTGDTIRTEVEVVSKRETSAGDRGLVVFRDHVLNQRDEVVFQIDKTTLIKRRDGTT